MGLYSLALVSYRRKCAPDKGAQSVLIGAQSSIFHLNYAVLRVFGDCISRNLYASVPRVRAGNEIREKKSLTP